MAKINIIFEIITLLGGIFPVRRFFFRYLGSVIDNVLGFIFPERFSNDIMVEIMNFHEFFPSGENFYPSQSDDVWNKPTPSSDL